MEPAISTREANKEKRRRRILDRAREIVATRGYDALNTRDLARAAGVTTPTLYNLVGNKNEILTTLCLDSMDRFSEIMGNIECEDVMAYFDGLITESRRVIEADERYYRGALLAMFRLSAARSPNTPEKEFFERGVEIAARGCRMAQGEGLLLGDVSAEELGTQIFTLYLAAWREWTYRRLSLEEFLRRSQQGFYMCLCSDAAPKFLLILRDRLSALRKARARPRRRRRRMA